MDEFSQIVEDADAIIVITVSDGTMMLTHSDNIDDSTVLDMLAAATSKLYNSVDSTWKH